MVPGVQCALSDTCRCCCDPDGPMWESHVHDVSARIFFFLLHSHEKSLWILNVTNVFSFCLNHIRPLGKSAPFVETSGQSPMPACGRAQAGCMSTVPLWGCSWVAGHRF